MSSFSSRTTSRAAGRVIGGVVGALLILGACATPQEAVTTQDAEADAPTSAAVASSTTVASGEGPSESAPTTETTTGSDSLPATPTTATPTTAPPTFDDVVLAYQPVVEIAGPIILTARPGDDVALLGTKAGVIHRFVDGSLAGTVLDISEQVVDSGERGFLGLALHPDDANRMFVHYSGEPDGRTMVSEFALDGDGVSHPETEHVLLTLDQPAGNHNGGMIQFGPDGALYLALGDGGGGGDQYGNAQNFDSLLGGLVRIDVDTGDAGLFASGLRNPWRTWIDGQQIYIADVGQGAFEEVDVAPLEEGRNYGWPVTEGLHCYSPPSGCDTDGFTLPLIEVEHGDAGTCSITGGVVYRGASIPALDGHYLYSDYCGGWLRSFKAIDGEAVERRDWTDQVGVPGQVVSFGVDGAGEVYVLTGDAVLRLVDAA